MRDKVLIAIGGLVTLLVLALQLPGRYPNLILCPWRRLTGTNCPGCGATRGVMALLRGDVAYSLRMHPLSPVFLALTVAITALAWLDLLRGSSLLRRAWDRSSLPISMTLLIAILVSWGLRTAGF